MDEDALFSESAMEGSLRGGANAFVDSMDDGGLETIKFESALASAEEADARLEEDGRRPPTPGKARAWLVKEGGGRDASPTRGEGESTGTRAAGRSGLVPSKDLCSFVCGARRVDGVRGALRRSIV